MDTPLKPMFYDCIVCGKQVTSLACDDPAHQEVAAEAMDTNAGVPVIAVTSTKTEDDTDIFDYLMEQPGIAANHLIESPLGMDIDECRNRN